MGKNHYINLEKDDVLFVNSEKSDIINQINISDEGIRLKGSKIIIDEGTLDANKINTINLD